jgi:flagellar biosynthetic protein FliR
MADSIWSSYIVFLYVLTRMSGVFIFNPFFGRKNVPAIVKMGLALLCAILVTPTLEQAAPESASGLIFMLALLKELFVGYMMGFVINLFLSWVLMAGEIGDIQIGLGMSKIYDQHSNIAMPVTGTIYNIMLTLIFFASNGHLTLIKIAAASCRAFPPGMIVINPQVASYLVELFGEMLSLAVKLAIPVIAIELLAEAGMGVLMRTVPQINVFVAGIQIKLIIGLVTMILAMTSVGAIFGNAVDYMFDKLEDCVILMLKG